MVSRSAGASGLANSSPRDWEQFFTFGDSERELLLVRVGHWNLPLEEERQPRELRPREAVSPKPFHQPASPLAGKAVGDSGLVRLLCLSSCVSGRPNPGGGARFEVFTFLQSGMDGRMNGWMDGWCQCHRWTVGKWQHLLMPLELLLLFL